MRINVIVLLLLICAVSLSAEDFRKRIFVKTDSVVKEYFVSDVSSVRFNDNSVLVNTSGSGCDEFSISSFRVMDFSSMHAQTSVLSTEETETFSVLSGGKVRITKNSPFKVRVYSVKGFLLDVIECKSGFVELELDVYGQGTFLVAADGEILKISVR